MYIMRDWTKESKAEREKNYIPIIEQVKKWKEKTGGLEQADYEAFEKNLERNKEKLK